MPIKGDWTGNNDDKNGQDETIRSKRREMRTRNNRIPFYNITLVRQSLHPMTTFRAFLPLILSKMIAVHR